MKKMLPVEELARDLGVSPENVVIEDDYPYTDGVEPAATMTEKDGAGW